MLPVLPPGTLVWGLGWYKRLKPGDVVIFHHNGKEKIKRIDKLDDAWIYVVGDHEVASTDSRQFGWLPREAIKAKVIWPSAPRYRAERVDPNQH